MTQDVALNRAQALELTAKLRTAATEFFELLEEAYTQRVHEILGYRTFRDYLNGEFPGFVPPKIDRDTRTAVIKGLLEAGMSTRDAAKATGVNQSTASRVKADANASPEDWPPADETEDPRRGILDGEPVWRSVRGHIRELRDMGLTPDEHTRSVVSDILNQIITEAYATLEEINS